MQALCVATEQSGGLQLPAEMAVYNCFLRQHTAKLQDAHTCRMPGRRDFGTRGKISRRNIPCHDSLCIPEAISVWEKKSGSDKLLLTCKCPVAGARRRRVPPPAASEATRTSGFQEPCCNEKEWEMPRLQDAQAHGVGIEGRHLTLRPRKRLRLFVLALLRAARRRAVSHLLQELVLVTSPMGAACMVSCGTVSCSTATFSLCIPCQCVAKEILEWCGTLPGGRPRQFLLSSMRAICELSFSQDCIELCVLALDGQRKKTTRFKSKWAAQKTPDWSKPPPGSRRAR